MTRAEREEGMSNDLLRECRQFVAGGTMNLQCAPSESDRECLNRTRDELLKRIDTALSQPSGLSGNAQRMVDAQANDAGLWFEARTAPEAYLQAALRKLHAAVEGDDKPRGLPEMGSVSVRFVTTRLAWRPFIRALLIVVFAPNLESLGAGIAIAETAYPPRIKNVSINKSAIDIPLPRIGSRPLGEVDHYGALLAGVEHLFHNRWAVIDILGWRFFRKLTPDSHLVGWSLSVIHRPNKKYKRGTGGPRPYFLVGYIGAQLPLCIVSTLAYQFTGRAPQLLRVGGEKGCDNKNTNREKRDKCVAIRAEETPKHIPCIREQRHTTPSPVAFLFAVMFVAVVIYWIAKK